MHTEEKETIAAHLKRRHCDISRYPVVIDEDDRCATFMLYNLSGQLTGYQTYRPDHDKEKHNDPRDGRYYTFRMKTSHDNGRKDTTAIAVFGIETLYYRPDVVFIVEGIFDAVRLHNVSLPAIATLSNDPKHLTGWLESAFSGRTKVVIPDNDTGGQRLAKFGDVVINLQPGEDVGSLTDDQIDQLLRDWI